MHVRAGRSIVRVPFFLLDYEGGSDVFHRRMIVVLNRDRSSNERSDVILEVNSSHELVEPRPHLEAIEFTQEGGEMKSDPAAVALFDVLDESGFGCVCPIVRRVVQLDKQIIFCEKCVVDFLCVLNVVHGEIVLAGQFPEPGFGGVYKWLVNATVLRQSDHAEVWGFSLRSKNAIHETYLKREQQGARQRIIK